MMENISFAKFWVLRRTLIHFEKGQNVFVASLFDVLSMASWYCELGRIVLAIKLSENMQPPASFDWDQLFGHSGSANTNGSGN